MSLTSTSFGEFLAFIIDSTDSHFSQIILEIPIPWDQQTGVTTQSTASSSLVNSAAFFKFFLYFLLPVSYSLV